MKRLILFFVFTLPFLGCKKDLSPIQSLPISLDVGNIYKYNYNYSSGLNTSWYCEITGTRTFNKEIYFVSDNQLSYRLENKILYTLAYINPPYDKIAFDYNISEDDVVDFDWAEGKVESISR